MVTPRAKLRLLHVSQPTDGGTARLVVQLTTAATGAGHDVTVVDPSPDALAALGRRTGTRLAAVEMPFAEAAIDVDKPADLALAEAVLANRA